MLRLGLVTDVHFGPAAYHAGKLRKLSSRAPELATQFATTMNRDVKPDVVAQLGDVIEDVDAEADAERYAHFVAIMNSLDAPTLHVAGNHDQVNLTAVDIARHWGRSGALHYLYDVGDTRFVVLATRTDAQGRPWLPPDQLRFASTSIDSGRGSVIVLMHHPAGEMDLTGNRWFEGREALCMLSNRSELRTIFEASGKVAAVFNGHCHWNHLSVINGIPYVTLQSLIENVADDAPGTPAAAHLVVELDTHVTRLRFEGAERFQCEVARSSAT